MMKDPTVRLVSVFVLGIIVGVGGFWLWQNRAIPVDDMSDESSLAEDNLQSIGAASSFVSEVEAPGTSLSVQQQIIRIEKQVQGDKVVVAQANLQSPAWVVIHDNNDGKPGSILGARLFDKGKNSGIVSLLRATEAGHSYIAMLHVYSGNRKPFDSKIDLPLADKDGNPIITTFSAINATN